MQIRVIGDVVLLKRLDHIEPVAIGDMLLSPYTVPHDAAEPVGLRMACDGGACGVATGSWRSALHDAPCGHPHASSASGADGCA